MDPIESIKQDRVEAQKSGDPNAGICFLALASKEGNASVRTLVLREISGNRFSLFMNQTSPKWQQLVDNADYEVLLWYPTRQKQYRIRGSCEILEKEVVKTNWFRRPSGSKLLDYVYKELSAQSSFIDSRQTLVDEIQRLKGVYQLDNMQPPEHVAGVELIATSIEMLDLNREDRIHDRRLFNLLDGKWQVNFMIP